MSRVVVVGAGVGGLAAAVRLAAAGHAVTVCEQAPVVGGKLGRLEQDGFAFDTGPSLLTLPQVFAALFAETGRPIGDVLDVVPVQPLARYRFADGTVLDLPSGAAASTAAVGAALGPAAAQDWAALLRRAERMWQATQGPFLSTAVRGPLDLVRQGVRLPDVRTVAPWRTLRGLGTSLLRDPRLRMVLDRYATYSGSDPRRAPAALAVIAHVEQAFGGWYVTGGLHRLGLALADRATECGARIRLGADVVEVTRSGSRADGVRLATGEHLAADVVVADVDAEYLYRDLVPERRALRRLRRATPSFSGFVLLLGLRGRTPDPVPHRVLFPAQYDAEFDAVFGGRPAADPTVYVSVPDDPATRPDADSEAWFVLVNAPRQGPVDWTAPGVADGYAERVLDLLAARSLDVRGRVVTRSVRTPADLARDTRAVGGSIYGTSSNGRQAAFLRPANASPVPGLFLVGGSGHPGGGLPLVALSAQIVAGLVGPAR